MIKAQHTGVLNTLYTQLTNAHASFISVRSDRTVVARFDWLYRGCVR